MAKVKAGGISPKRKRLLAVAIALLLFGGLAVMMQDRLLGGASFREIPIGDVLGYRSVRAETDDMVVASASEPLYAAIATPLAVWYDIGDKAGGYGLKPLLVVDDVVNDAQLRFVSMMDIASATVLGDVDAGCTENDYDLPPAGASIRVAGREFIKMGGAVVVDAGPRGYEFAVDGGVLASYLNVPLLVYENNPGAISDLLRAREAKYVVALGKDAGAIGRAIGLPTVILDSHEDVRDASLKVVRHRFGRLDYMVMANPSDARPPSIVETKVVREEGHMSNLKLLVGGNDLDLSGASSIHYDVKAPTGPVLVKMWANITAYDTYLRQVKREIGVEPIISIEVRDPDGNPVAYAPSFSNRGRSAYVEFLMVDFTAPLDVKVSLFYGTKGLSTIFWGSSGYSRVDADYELTVELSSLEDAHWPLLEGASMMAPYLAAAHGGIVLADGDMAMTDADYAELVSGYAGGPWYERDIAFASNVKASRNAELLNATVEAMAGYDATATNGSLSDTYTGEHGWLAIVGDSNMIPFHYYEKEASWEEDPIYGVGWPGDNIYNYDGALSPGRLMASSVADISAMVARTLFYASYANRYMDSLSADYPDPNDWADHYGLLYGEGGGQTGGLFWQDPYTVELEQHGWSVLKYGNNLNNDRQTMEAVGAYRRANYFEIMLHGNWYWYVPELNGADSYSTAVKVTDVNTWELGPTVFLTAACLMGRVDGIPPENQISMAFIHAGVNVVFSSTRSTGSESSTREIERDLLYNDTTVGEALRDQKLVKPAPPTLYVRLLFGDPAFNPHEPENGFSDQGRPVMI